MNLIEENTNWLNSDNDFQEFNSYQRVVNIGGLTIKAVNFETIKELAIESLPVSPLGFKVSKKNFCSYEDFLKIRKNNYSDKNGLNRLKSHLRKSIKNVVIILEENKEDLFESQYYIDRYLIDWQLLTLWEDDIKRIYKTLV